MKSEFLSIETTMKLANRDKAIKYIKKEIKNMPYNGCKIKLNRVLKILEGNN